MAGSETMKSPIAPGRMISRRTPFSIPNTDRQARFMHKRFTPGP